MILGERKMLKRCFDAFWYAIMGGLCIGLGATAYLCTENAIFGSVLFTLGLFTICTMGFNLFTGKVSYALEKKPYRFISFVLIWLGNLVGTVGLALLLGLTRIGESLHERAAVLCATKLGDNPLSVFILAIFCNLLIFIAVDGFKNNPHPLGKYIGLFLGVIAFIFCGYEHCIANMFYFAAGGAFSLKTLLYLLIITAGNALGGLLIPIFRVVHNKLTDNDM